MTDITETKKVLVGDSYVDVVIPQLRQTINSQAEVIAELETVRVHLMKEIEENINHKYLNKQIVMD